VQASAFAWISVAHAALGDVLESYPAIPDFSAKASAPAQSWGGATARLRSPSGAGDS